MNDIVLNKCLTITFKLICSSIKLTSNILPVAFQFSRKYLGVMIGLDLHKYRKANSQYSEHSASNSNTLRNFHSLPRFKFKAHRMSSFQHYVMNSTSGKVGKLHTTLYTCLIGFIDHCLTGFLQPWAGSSDYLLNILRKSIKFAAKTGFQLICKFRVFNQIKCLAHFCQTGLDQLNCVLLTFFRNCVCFSDILRKFLFNFRLAASFYEQIRSLQSYTTHLRSRRGEYVFYFLLYLIARRKQYTTLLHIVFLKGIYVRII